MLFQLLLIVSTTLVVHYDNAATKAPLLKLPVIPSDMYEAQWFLCQRHNGSKCIITPCTKVGWLNNALGEQETEPIICWVRELILGIAVIFSLFRFQTPHTARREQMLSF